MDPFTMAVWSAGVIAALAGTWVYVRFLRRQAGPLSFAVLARATLTGLLASAALWLGASAAARLLGAREFAIIHLAYAWLALTPAALGIAGLRWAVPRTRGRGRLLVNAAAAGAVLVLPVCVYASFIEPFWLDVERVGLALPQLAAKTAPESVRIVLLADLQTDRYSGYERGVLARIRAEKPDLILLPGDFFHCTQRLFDERRADFARLLRDLATILPPARDSARQPDNAADAAVSASAGPRMFACLGNIDRPTETAELLAAAGIRLLEDEVETVTIRGVRIAVGGIGPHSGRSAAATFRRLGQTRADVRLMLSHYPDGATLARPEDRIDLVLAGHTHGGQVQIPGFGPPLTLSRVPRHVAAGGLHELHSQRLYVSRGVGHERRHAPPLRFWCRPELTVLTLRPPAQ